MMLYDSVLLYCFIHVKLDTHTHTHPSSTGQQGLSCFIYFMPTPLFAVVPTLEVSIYKEFSSFNGGPRRPRVLTFICGHSNNKLHIQAEPFLAFFLSSPFFHGSRSRLPAKCRKPNWTIDEVSGFPRVR